MYVRCSKARARLTYELACVVHWLVKVKKLTQRETAALLGFGEGTIGRGYAS